MTKPLLLIACWSLAALAGAFHEKIALFAVNAEAGCWPWSPSVVDYRPGMTVCPGQTVRAVIIIEVPRERPDSI